MSTASADPDGFVVITQISPQPNEEDPPGKGRGASDATKNLKPLQRFYKGEPQALGVTQILTGIVQILLGLLYDVSLHPYSFRTYPLFVTAVPYWSGILYIISGSLSVASANKPRIGLVRVSLTMNVISTVAAGVAIIVYVLGYAIVQSLYFYDYWSSLCDGTDQQQCLLHRQHNSICIGILYILLAFTLLEFCVTISTSAFACKTICRTSYSEVTVVVYQTTSVDPAYPGASADPPTYEELKKP